MGMFFSGYSPHQGYGLFYDTFPTKGMFFQDTVTIMGKGICPLDESPHP